MSVRVVLTKALILDDDFSFELISVEYDGDSRGIISQDDRRPYMCFYGTELAEHSLATAAEKMGGWGACSLIGNENHVLTNQHVVISEPEITYGEIWFNWFNESCDPKSPVNEPVCLKPGNLLTMRSSGSRCLLNGNGWHHSHYY